MNTLVKNHSLFDLPNLSVLMCEALQHAGISNAGALCEAGAEKCWLLMHSQPVHASAHSLLALEGAIRGIDWRAIPYDRRLELERFALDHGARRPPASFARPV